MENVLSNGVTVYQDWKDDLSEMAIDFVCDDVRVLENTIASFALYLSMRALVSGVCPDVTWKRLTPGFRICKIRRK